MAALSRLVQRRPLRVAGLGAQALVRGAWRQDARLVCLPGGRDLPYLRALRGAGAAHIRAFVRGGGRYLGVCAGAYFAAAHINFAPGTAHAVRGARPLRLFAGVAQGPLMADGAAFDYAHGGGAQLGEVTFTAAGVRLPVYNHGGCAFAAAAAGAWPAAARVLATAADGRAAVPVCVRLPWGRGQVLLWGMHPEFDADVVAALHPHRPWAAALAATQALRRHLLQQQLRQLLFAA